MKKYLPLFLVTTVFGCLPPQEPGISIETYYPVPFEEVGRGRTAISDTVHQVIQDATEWESLSDSLNAIVPMRAIDFDLEMVMIAALPVSGGGYDLRFEEVQDTGESLVARYRLYMPAEDCRPISGEGSVFQAIRMSNSSTSVEFERTEEKVQCTDS